jgi:hypothetical protein
VRPCRDCDFAAAPFAAFLIITRGGFWNSSDIAYLHYSEDSKLSLEIVRDTRHELQRRFVALAPCDTSP